MFARAPIDVDIGDDDAGLMALPVQRPSDDSRRPTFELDYELDLDYNEVETLELPELSRGRYMHDFKVRRVTLSPFCRLQYIDTRSLHIRLLVG